MPRAGRLLAFRSPSARVLSASEADSLAAAFLSQTPDARSQSDWAELRDAEFSFHVVERLRGLTNKSPESIHHEALAVYQHLEEIESLGVFDERDYLLGETALTAANTARLTGRFEAAEDWLDTAEKWFGHTVNAAPSITRVSHARAALHYDMRRYDRVLASIPDLIRGYERLGMQAEVKKVRYLEAVTYKETGDADKSLASFLSLRDSFGSDEANFRTLVLTGIAEEYARRGAHEESLRAYAEAIRVVDEVGDSMASAQLKGSVGETYRSRGEYRAAAECLRSAISSYRSLGMETRVAYLRVILAESLLAADRHREAEWEILAALPVIEEQRMVAEGFTAIAILRESASRRSLDRPALTQLRQKLQAS